MPVRTYVILHHRTDRDEHWDFMLELDDALATWQLDREPTSRAALPCAGRRIADHRKAYLTYEGPVSHQRGQVSRVDTGTYRLLRQTDSAWDIEVLRGRLTGRLLLRRTTGPENWELSAP